MLTRIYLLRTFKKTIGLVFFSLCFFQTYSQTDSAVIVDTPIVLIDTFKVAILDSSNIISLDSAQLLKKQTRNEKTQKIAKIFSYVKYKDNGKRTDFSGAEKYKLFKGRKIHSIQIEILKPSGNPDDTTEHINRIEKFANKIHFTSKEKFIKADILFKEGDKVNPTLFADTEKLLWDRKKFKDIDIHIIENKETKDVDVLIYLQDNLSWTIGLGYYNRPIFGITANNFFGHPNTLFLYTGINFNKYNLWAVGGTYKYENIKATQINFTTSFLIEKLNQKAFVSLNRKFFSIKSQWAFNAKYSYNYTTRSLSGKRLDKENYRSTKSNFYSLWLAYALPMAKIFSIKDEKLKLVFATKINNIDYKKRPFISSTLYDKVYVNQQNYKFGIGVARWDFYQTKNSYYIDVPEYFPRGYSASFWIGSQFDEVFKRRISLDFTVNYGIHFKKIGYFYPQYNFTGYILQKKGQEMISKISVDYVSNKVNLGKVFYFRQIIKLATNIGSAFPAERYFNVNDENGLRGFYSPPLRGSKSVTINMESDFFIDKKIAWSKVMPYVFCDLAWLSQNDKRLFTESVFQYGLGFGLKYRSPSLGVPFVDFQLGFYPRGKNFEIGLVLPNIYGNNPNAIQQNNMLVE